MPSPDLSVLISQDQLFSSENIASLRWSKVSQYSNSRVPSNMPGGLYVTKNQTKQKTKLKIKVNHLNLNRRLSAARITNKRD